MENKEPRNSSGGDNLSYQLIFLGLSLLAYIGALYAIGIREPLVVFIGVIWIIRLGIQRAR